MNDFIEIAYKNIIDFLSCPEVIFYISNNYVSDEDIKKLYNKCIDVDDNNSDCKYKLFIRIFNNELGKFKDSYKYKIISKDMQLIYKYIGLPIHDEIIGKYVDYESDDKFVLTKYDLSGSDERIYFNYNGNYKVLIKDSSIIFESCNCYNKVISSDFVLKKEKTNRLEIDIFNDDCWNSCEDKSLLLKNGLVVDYIKNEKNKKKEKVYMR